MIHKKISVKIGEHHPTAEITTYMIGNSEELYDGRLRPLDYYMYRVAVM